MNCLSGWNIATYLFITSWIDVAREGRFIIFILTVAWMNRRSSSEVQAKAQSSHHSAPLGDWSESLPVSQCLMVHEIWWDKYPCVHDFTSLRSCTQSQVSYHYQTALVSKNSIQFRWHAADIKIPWYTDRHCYLPAGVLIAQYMILTTRISAVLLHETILDGSYCCFSTATSHIFPLVLRLILALWLSYISAVQGHPWKCACGQMYGAKNLLF